MKGLSLLLVMLAAAGAAPSGVARHLNGEFYARLAGPAVLVKDSLRCSAEPGTIVRMLEVEDATASLVIVRAAQGPCKDFSASINSSLLSQ